MASEEQFVSRNATGMLVSRNGARMVVLRCSLLGALRKSIEEVLGETAAAGLLYRCYKKAIMESLDITRPLATESARELLEHVFRRGIELGLYVKYELLEVTPSKLTFRVYDSAFAHESSANRPICYLISGRMAGTISAITNENIECREVMCKAMGDPYCEFLAVRDETP